ncbi:hypothetical protein LXL04_007455 [Taraxacum kok-saghyz]
MESDAFVLLGFGNSINLQMIKYIWSEVEDWMGIIPKKKDENLDEIMNWFEWILSHSLLRIAESNPYGLDQFWLTQGADILLNLMQSFQEDVQERSATGLATFVVIDDENANVDVGTAEAVMKGCGIQLLLGLARSWKEGLQSEATKAIVNLSVNPAFAKAVAAGGGITILASLARSMNRLVAEEAAGGLWNLSVGEEHKYNLKSKGIGTNIAYSKYNCTGSRFELSDAPLETLHQTCAEVNSHLYQNDVDVPTEVVIEQKGEMEMGRLKKNCSNLLNQAISAHTRRIERYSASAEDNETVTCFFDFHEIGAPPNNIK